MATATAPAPRTRAKSKTQAEVETSETPAPVTVVDSGLRRLVVAWKKNDITSSQGWMQIAKYVVDNEKIDRPQLLKALIDFRGLNPNSAKVTATHILAIRKSDEAQALLDRALGGDTSITVADLRSSRARSGEQSTADLEEVFERKLKTVARFAIKNGLVEDDEEFATAAQNAFRAVTAAAEQAAAEGDETEEEGGEEEEES